MFEAQMPSVILGSVAVMKSSTMVFISTGYPVEIAWVDESTPTKGIDKDWEKKDFRSSTILCIALPHSMVNSMQ
jgi:hypothetical protein